MSGKARFVHWLTSEFEDIQSEPMFNVVSNDLGISNGSTVSGEMLLQTYGIPLPLFPSLETWRREVLCKRRCGRCWAVTRGLTDLVRHNEHNHKTSPYLPPPNKEPDQAGWPFEFIGDEP